MVPAGQEEDTAVVPEAEYQPGIERLREVEHGTVMQARVSAIRLFAGFDVQCADRCHQPDERGRV